MSPNFIFITFAHIKIMKHNTSVQNTGFLNNVIDFAGSGCSCPLHESRRKSGVFGIFSSPGFAGISGVPGSPGRWKIHADRLFPPHWVSTLSAHRIPVPALLRTSTGLTWRTLTTSSLRRSLRLYRCHSVIILVACPQETPLPLAESSMRRLQVSASLHSVRSSGASGFHRSFSSLWIRA